MTHSPTHCRPVIICTDSRVIIKDLASPMMLDDVDIVKLRKLLNDLHIAVSQQ